MKILKLFRALLLVVFGFCISIYSYDHNQSKTEFGVISVGNMQILRVPILIDGIMGVYHLALDCTVSESNVLEYCKTKNLSRESCDSIIQYLRRILSDFLQNSPDESRNCQTLGVPHEKYDTKSSLLSLEKFYEIPILTPGSFVFNPGFVRYREKIVMSFRLSSYGDGLIETVDNIGIATWRSIDDMWSFFDGNFSVFPATYTLEYLSSSDVSLGRSMYVVGEDARLIVVQDKLYVVYNSIDRKLLPFRCMRFAEFLIDEKRATAVVVGKSHVLDSSIIFGDAPQKNWVPFEHNGRLLFSYSISPHVVVEPVLDRSILASLYDKQCTLSSIVMELLPFCRFMNISNSYLSNTEDIISIRLISVTPTHYLTRKNLSIDSSLRIYNDYFGMYLGSPFIDDAMLLSLDRPFPSNFGLLRGGTPLLALDTRFQLGFFHNFYFDNIIGRARFGMGAYLVQNRPPFQVMAISSTLLYPEYLQPEIVGRLNLIEDVLYPCGISWNEPHEVILTIGYNDKKGFIMTMKLIDVLSTMEFFQW